MVKIKSRLEILAQMREGSIMEEYATEIGIKIKRRILLTMVDKGTDEIRTKITIQMAKEESELKSIQQSVKILEELIAEEERAEAKK